MAITLNGTDGIIFPDASVQTTATTYKGGNVVIFTSSTTWSPPLGVTSAIFTVVGGGGGGRGTTNPAEGGNGGLASAYCVDISGSISITVGAAGNGNASGNGFAGGTSSVTGTGVSISATGGGGGISSVKGANGTGTVSTGATLKALSLPSRTASSGIDLSFNALLPFPVTRADSNTTGDTAIAWTVAGNFPPGLGGKALFNNCAGVGGVVMVEF